MVTAPTFDVELRSSVALVTLSASLDRALGLPFADAVGRLMSDPGLLLAFAASIPDDSGDAAIEAEEIRRLAHAAEESR